MNFLPAVLLYLNFSPSDSLFITAHFYNTVDLVKIHREEFEHCMNMIKLAKTLLKSLDLDIYLSREDILDSILIKWFTSFFCTLFNPQEVSSHNFAILANFKAFEFHVDDPQVRNCFICASSSLDLGVPSS